MITVAANGHHASTVNAVVLLTKLPYRTYQQPWCWSLSRIWRWQWLADPAPPEILALEARWPAGIMQITLSSKWRHAPIHSCGRRFVLYDYRPCNIDSSGSSIKYLNEVIRIRTAIAAA